MADAFGVDRKRVDFIKRAVEESLKRCCLGKAVEEVANRIDLLDQEKYFAVFMMGGVGGMSMGAG